MLQFAQKWIRRRAISPWKVVIWPDGRKYTVFTPDFAEVEALVCRNLTPGQIAEVITGAAYPIALFMNDGGVIRKT
jgi:hypothetical protein